MEYASSIWDPHLAKDCDLLEKLQWHSVRFVKGDYRTTSSVSQMLHGLGWCDLKDRLCSTRLSLGIWPLIQIRLVWWLQTTGANHRYKFRAIGASSTGLRYSFAVRTVSDWNQLPAVVVEQENAAAFKAQLARCATVRMP